MKQTLNTTKHGLQNDTNRLEILRQRINDENYLHAAIQRLALVISNGLIEISKEGGYYERKKWK
jgi:hypothetical protein